MAELVIRLATRGSALALWQANRVADLIRKVEAGCRVETVIVSTRPDRLTGVSLEKMGGDKGLFVKEVEQAVLDGRADAAVHSLKDVPVDEMADGLRLAAFPDRADPADVLVTQANVTLEGLPAGAVVATSALRRQAQLLHLRPDLTVCGVRGNVETRIRKLQQGEFDAIIMAAAGLDRLGLTAQVSERFAPGRFVPAPGQGTLVVQALQESKLDEVWRRIDNRAVRLQATLERDIARRLGATCRSAAGCLVTVDDGGVHGRAVVCSPDGKVRLEAEASAEVEDCERLAEEIAEDLLRQGSAAYL